MEIATNNEYTLIEQSFIKYTNTTVFLKFLLQRLILHVNRLIYS